MTLSIIIPAFNEARKITRDMETAGGFLAAHEIAGEVIVVDDGSADGTTDAAHTAQVPANVKKTVITANQHRGKGFAIRTGVLASTCEYVLFADSGCTVPYKNVLEGLRLIREGQCEIAHGSRRLPKSAIRKEQDWDRQWISRFFHWVVFRWMHLPVHLTDTQCGFKVYRGDTARSLYAECFTEGFMFDIEIILRALHKGIMIMEFPVEWTCDRDSRISITRTLLPVFRELLAIKRRLLTQR